MAHIISTCDMAHQQLHGTERDHLDECDMEVARKGMEEGARAPSKACACWNNNSVADKTKYQQSLNNNSH